MGVHIRPRAWPGQGDAEASPESWIAAMETAERGRSSPWCEHRRRCSDPWCARRRERFDHSRDGDAAVLEVGEFPPTALDRSEERVM